ncbi:hypothetical protein FOQG_19127 [Fusarium oxysporum f. sp. raphani 54005]|uniref:Uncharacterized protein n=1 Tax=Fusarium oxysporum f. sp. raphani 54005 TaxID=1089458 RepID=X0BBB6_FUSOX|nr:hypothetical protein FOQG_19127 [Fusarium oxysporum f. sp. raphani 54005]
MKLGSQPGRSERQWRTKSAPNWIIPRSPAGTRTSMRL